jgi:hypothetical protein
MKNKLVVCISIILLAGLTMSINAAQRMVVCEEAYSEG